MWSGWTCFRSLSISCCTESDVWRFHSKSRRENDLIKSQAHHSTTNGWGGETWYDFLSKNNAHISSLSAAHTAAVSCLFMALKSSTKQHQTHVLSPLHPRVYRNLFLTHLSSRLIRSYFVHSFTPSSSVRPTIRPIRRVVSRSLSVFLPRRSAFRSNRRPLWFLCELRLPSVCSVLCSLWSEKWVDLLHYQHYIYLINTHIHRVSCSHAMGESCWVAFLCWWRAVRFFYTLWVEWIWARWPRPTLHSWNRMNTSSSSTARNFLDWEERTKTKKRHRHITREIASYDKRGMTIMTLVGCASSSSGCPMVQKDKSEKWKTNSTEIDTNEHCAEVRRERERSGAIIIKSNSLLT